MYLETIEVKRYRSISSLRLEPCGDFNVFIGKNSAGKSNILTSIDAFFGCATSDVIRLNPPLGDSIDFFRKELSDYISIQAVFRLLQSEQDRLLTDIGAERPQVKTLLDDIEPEARLLIEICINPPPHKFAFARNICFINESTGNKRFLFEIGTQAAKELFQRASNAQRANNDKRALDRFLAHFDSNDYRTMERSREGGATTDYYLRRYLEPGDTALLSQINKLFHLSEGYETFVTSVRQALNAAEAQAISASNLPTDSPIKTFSGEERVVPRYVKELLGRIGSTKILHLRERRVPIGSDEARRLLSLKVKRGGTDILSGIQTTVNELLGVKVDAFEGTDRRGEDSAELDVDEFLIQVNGSGIREALRLILDSELGKPDIMLVEEPEIHLHPALETSIMGYLREVSKRTQVFITTHSTNFLDSGNFQNVFLVTKNGSTTISPLTLAQAQEKLPSELGIRLSSLFMYDQIIFVEGPSDELIIREFSKVLNVNFGRKNIGFIQMRGVRNIGHYAAAEVVSFLTRRQVKLWFLVDGDEASSVHFQRLKNDFGSNAKLHVLKRREIENYLLAPNQNIQHLIDRKRAARDGSFQRPEETDFRAKLEAAAESLKPLTIWKRICAQTRRPIYPPENDPSIPTDVQQMKARAVETLSGMQTSAADAIADMDRICIEAEAEVENAWKNRKFEIVPGSFLLDEVYKEYGFRYDKMRDGVAVASCYSSLEIEQEIREFIVGL